MIDTLNEWLTGKFENKMQAFSNPSKYAMIRITHIPIWEGGWFYGEQAYTYQANKPYRQFVLHPEQDGSTFKILNYEIEGKQQFVNGKNLDKLTKDMVKLKDGCTVNLTFANAAFTGGLTGCDCHVKWNGSDTYLQNEIELTSKHYCVKDLGFCRKEHHQIWGSKYGRFEFIRLS